jgi:hypothetical protein
VALKSRNHYGDLLQQAEEHLLTLNKLISNVEIASMQKDVVAAIEKGTSALKIIQGDMSVDYVERLLEENAELTDAVREVSALLGSSTTDESAVLDELSRLEDLVALEGSSAIAAAPIAPLTSILAVPQPIGTNPSLEIAS